MWGNQPPPYGGYYWVPGPVTPMQEPERRQRPVSLKKRLKQLQQDKEDLDAYIEELKKMTKDKDDKKKDKEDKLSILQLSMVMMLCSPFLAFIELYIYKQLFH